MTFIELLEWLEEQGVHIRTVCLWSKEKEGEIK
jgi:hypothetical protein